MRTKYIAGNWKMNLDRESALGLAGVVADFAAGKASLDVGIFPPAVYLADVVKAAAGTGVRVWFDGGCWWLEESCTTPQVVI